MSAPGLCRAGGCADGDRRTAEGEIRGLAARAIDYLERVCTVNLRKLSFIMREIRAYAQKSGLKPSVTVYKQWAVKKKSGQGHKPVIRLRFSKSGDPDIERWYSTHFVDAKKIAELKAQHITEAATNAAEPFSFVAYRSRGRT